MGFVLVVRNLCCWRRWALGSTWYSLSIWMVWVFCLNDCGPVWSSSSNNNFHTSNTLTDISIHFFIHTYFKKFQKTSNNNSQTHSPNRPLNFWFLLVLGTSDRRRKETPRKQKKNKHRRTEKKEKLENAEEGVKIRFVLFISFLFCGLRFVLGLHFRICGEDER